MRGYSERKQRVYGLIYGAGWSVHRLSQRMGVHDSFVSKLLSGQKRCLARLREVSRLTGAPLDELLPDEE